VTAEERTKEIETAFARSAARIFDILTRWLSDHPKASLDTRRSLDGRVQLTIRDAHMIHVGGTMIYSSNDLASFQGETLQDAYAQAAMTIEFNGGSL
jgi:hypothetical protein